MKKIEYVERLVQDLNGVVQVKESLLRPGMQDWGVQQALDDATKIIGDELKKLKEGKPVEPSDIPF